MKVNFYFEIDEYLNMLFSYGLLLIVIKSIRIICYFVIFIDYIYINYFIFYIILGIVIIDIFDYLFVFCIFKL